MTRVAWGWAACTALCLFAGNFPAAYVSLIVILYETRIFKPRAERRGDD